MAAGGDEGVVRQGAFCSPQGATGHTSKGTAMVCGDQDANGRYHWHAA